MSENEQTTRITCTSCPHACSISPQGTGRCRARVVESEGEDARIVSGNYGRIAAIALDPIEKKPLARFHPGTTILSIGSYGCNMNCPFCQNAEIAQEGDDVAWRPLDNEWIVQRALDMRNRGCIGVAYTYNEPLVGWEYVRDMAQRVHEEDMVNVLVSNGMANDAVLDELAPLIDAANIDLKCFSEEGYRSLGGDFATVCATIERLAKLETCHLEVTTLIVPGFNDDGRDVEAAAQWLASLDPGITYHVTRFYPANRMIATPPTPVPTMRRMAEIAHQYLDDVLLGNMPPGVV